MRRGTAIIVFARAPVPGRAKTRLAPRLGEGGAARLQARLTLRTLQTALAARCGAVELHGTALHRLFSHYQRKLPVKLERQRGRDLGERMYSALSGALRRHRAVLLIGTDCPALRPADLRRAARWLRSCDAVVGPAEDGGYVLIGTKRLSPRLFEGVQWGGPQVYGQTRERLDRLGYRWRMLRMLWDLDRPADLERFRALRFSAGLPRPARQ